jgi:leucyl-tRNA synthetase
MDERYKPSEIEEKWQKHWAESRVFEVEAQPGQPKFYCLEMLPYPSGRLHMGHVRNYSIGDALSWFKRLQGFNVLHPIGWDSFGQPAEQAAIKSGVNPREWTERNIAYMRGQLKKLGISYDWRREIAAHTPEYYKFDQWFFLKMYERGLIYRKNTQVNWCETCSTTLSNEQASGGLCWRCGKPVSKKDLEQWFVRITDYAEQLLNDMDEIAGGWPEKVLTMQRNWIGRSEGAFVDFAVSGYDDQKVRVFTTRIDTIYGATAIVVAAEHPLIKELINELPNKTEAEAFIAKVRADKLIPKDPGAEEEKEGVNTGLLAVNPFSGEEIPVWIGNYVLMEYGTGAVMSVPAHDERDFEFATKYGMDIRVVISGGAGVPPASDAAFTDYGVMINSNEWNGRTTAEAKREMAHYAADRDFGEAAITYRLRDWGISRQRFWGAPIPMIHCGTCGILPVPYEQLPVRLPDNAAITGTGESPLAKVPEFVNVECFECGGPARRETDTMDTFVDSSWYYFRYCDPRNEAGPVDAEIADYWTPVEQYIGGVEHAVMHLLYTRFWTKFMRDIGLVKFNEPVKRLMTQGMVIAETFYRTDGENKVWFNPELVEIERDQKGKITRAILSGDGQPVEIGAMEKMSKSKNNGVDPDAMVGIYGADAVRLFILFAAPVENDLAWKESGIEGGLRFLRRVYAMVYKAREHLQDAPAAAPSEFDDKAAALRRKTHQTIQRVTHDLERFQMNTSIAALMELSNTLSDFIASPHDATPANLYAAREAMQSLTLMLSPFAPHTAEELWAALGHEGGILNTARWPIADAELAKKDELEIPVQINGKLRAKLNVAADISKEDMEAAALADEKVQSFIAGQTVVKTIVVPQRLVNIVVR